MHPLKSQNNKGLIVNLKKKVYGEKRLFVENSGMIALRGYIFIAIVILAIGQIFWNPYVRREDKRKKELKNFLHKQEEKEKEENSSKR